MQRTLFANARVLACSDGDAAPFLGHVLVEGDKIVEVGEGRMEPGGDWRAIDLGGATILPGLGDAHVHFGQPLDFEFDFAAVMAMPPDDAALSTAAVAREYLENGITTCVSGGIAQPHGDVALAKAVDSGWVPGPRIVAGGAMISDPEGIPTGVMPTSVAEMRAAVAEQCDMGVRVIKLFLSGENVMPPGSPEYPVDRTYMNEALVSAAVEEASRYGAFVQTHARGAGSVKLSARCGVRLISHASYVDEEGMALLQDRDDVWVCPGLHYLWSMPNLAPEPYASMSEPYRQEYVDAAQTARLLDEAGIPLLPGGDYGHTWIPHGQAAKDIQHFVEQVGVSPAKAIRMATANFGGLTGMPVGRLEPGFYADMLVVDGDPLADVTILQQRDRRRCVVKGGEIAWQNPERLRAL